MTISSISENELAVIVHQEDSVAEVSLNRTKESYEQEITNITNEIMEKCFINEEESDPNCRIDDSNVSAVSTTEIVTKTSNLDSNLSLDVNVSSNFNQDFSTSSEISEKQHSVDSKLVDSEPSTYSSSNSSSNCKDFDLKTDVCEESTQIPPIDTVPQANVTDVLNEPSKDLQNQVEEVIDVSSKEKDDDSNLKTETKLGNPPKTNSDTSTIEVSDSQVGSVQARSEEQIAASNASDLDISLQVNVSSDSIQ